MTNRQFISEIQNDLRALNIDQALSKEYILMKGRGFVSLFIKQDSDNRRLFRMMELFTTINCLPLQPAPVAECCDISLPCKNFVRSVKRIPELYPTIYGVILRVFTINGLKEFIATTPHEYQYTLLRSFRNKAKGAFWLQDGYLVIPDEDIEVVKASGMFVSPLLAKQLECNPPPQQRDAQGFCLGILDDEFICPGHLIKSVRQETVKDLVSFMARDMASEDNRPDKNVHTKQ